MTKGLYYYTSFIYRHTCKIHLQFIPVLSGIRVTRSLVLCVCFVDRCLSFCTFSFGHCVVCSSLIYGFWLPIWYLPSLLVLFLLVIALSGLLRITDSDYPFGIFKLFLSFCTFSFSHCIVWPSSIYGFWLPLWYLQSLLVLFPLVIALSCLLQIIDSDYPFGTFKLFLSFCPFSFGHCIVCSSSI